MFRNSIRCLRKVSLLAVVALGAYLLSIFLIGSFTLEYSHVIYRETNSIRRTADRIEFKSTRVTEHPSTRRQSSPDGDNAIEYRTSTKKHTLSTRSTHGVQRSTISSGNMTTRPNHQPTSTRHNSVTGRAAELSANLSTTVGMGSYTKTISSVTRWNNLPIDLPEDSPGEFGKPFVLHRENLTLEEQTEWDEGYKYAGYNVFVSDRIALRRRVPDFRAEVCRNMSYPANLPQASVVIPYHKEALSTLMRTVYSTLDRAPPGLLKEIILVDDFSESEQLLDPLDHYVSVLPKVKVLRNTQREGLMRTRMRGVYAATAPVVIIKDAHTEYMQGWLEPLIDAIVKNRTTIAIAHVNLMNIDHFGFYQTSATTGIHSFDFRLSQRTWGLDEKQVKARTSEAESIVSPTMLGTEFAVDKEFFLRIGGYDPGMEIWGGEEMELSFKVWMCGGSMKIIPCSCVVHLFRQPHHRTHNDCVRNDLRVAQVWMDEYKHFVYQRFGHSTDKLDIGNVTDRIELRRNLQCKSFDWYLRNVATMVYVPRDIIAQGEIQNVGLPSWCLRSFFLGFSNPDKKYVSARVCRGEGIELSYHDEATWHHPAKLNSCCLFEATGSRHPPTTHRSIRFWIITGSGQIRKDAGCLTYNNDNNKLLYLKCNNENKNQIWELTNSTSIVHVYSAKCLELQREGKDVVLGECIEGTALQQWTVVPRPNAPLVS